MGIKIGEKCPDFSLLDQNGELITIKNIIGEKNIVIYFYDNKSYLTTVSKNQKNEH